MPIMQVTFNDVTQPPPNPGISGHLSTLMFQIEYRGKSYDCVGHLRRSEVRDEDGSSEIMFSGYYGYNGPIDIQELRKAAIDYYQSVAGDSGTGFIKRLRAQLNTEKLPATNRCYEFNVGSNQQQILKQAS